MEETQAGAPQFLMVDEYGAYLGKRSQRIQVRKGSETLREMPLLKLEGVIVSSQGVTLSSDAIAACAQAGIPIHFVRYSGWVEASIYSAGLIGTVQTRRAQLAALNAPSGVALARSFARAKIANQAALIRYLAKYRRAAEPELGERLEAAARGILRGGAEIDALAVEQMDEIRLPLLAAEGRAADRYWQAVRLAVRVPEGWPGRVGRGADDPFNASLNYGYGILYCQVERAVVLAGLDPYGGFIHADRPGKPSLVLDLIEEFRAPAVDRAIFALWNRGGKVELDQEGRLPSEARRGIADAVLDRLERDERYHGRKLALRHVIQTQARQVATYLRGDRKCYEPFIARW